MMRTNSIFRLALAALGALGVWLLELALASAIETHVTPMLAQPLARGEIIRDEMIVDQEIKRSPAGFDYITYRVALIGMAAKRPLRAGVPLRVSDIAQPNIIRKGDLVTVAFEAPGLSLSIRGKALEDGVSGQAIRVMNTQTNRTFEGVAVSSGYVLVSPMANSPAAPQSILPRNAAAAASIAE